MDISATFAGFGGLVTDFDIGEDGRRELDRVVLLRLRVGGLDQRFGSVVQRNHPCGDAELSERLCGCSGGGPRNGNY